MEMRKILAVALALAQLVFGAVLISRGTAMDRKAETHVNEIRFNGQPILFELSSFFYFDGSEPPLEFNLERTADAYESYGSGRYEAIVTDEYGHSRLGPSYDKPPEGPYLDWNLELLYSFDADSVREAFAGEDPDNHWFIPSMIGANKGKFVIGGESHRVYAVAYVYQGELVYTGIMIGNELY